MDIKNKNELKRRIIDCKKQEQEKKCLQNISFQMFVVALYRLKWYASQVFSR